MRDKQAADPKPHDPLAHIQTLAGDNQSLLRSLAYGYLRGLDAKTIVRLLAANALNQPISTRLIKTFVDAAEPGDADALCIDFVARLRHENDYRAIRRYGFYLDKLYECASPAPQREIVRTFLASGRRYLRKYAYAKRLDLLGPWFERASNHPEAEEYQVRSLYLRKAELTDADWTRLRENLPLTFIYLAACKGRYVPDEVCQAIYHGARADLPPFVKHNVRIR